MRRRRSKKGKSRARRWLSALCLAYLVLLTGGGAAVHLIAESAWLTTVALYLPQALWGLPLALLLPAALLLRDRRSGGLCLLASLVVAGPLMGFHAPWPRQLPPGTRLRVLAWNIHAGTGGMDRIAGEIRRWQPDVVILTEARPGARAMRQSLAQLFPDWSRSEAEDVFLASRSPAAAEAATALPGFPPRAIAQLRLRVNGRMVTVLGTHFVTAFRGDTLRHRSRRLPDVVRETSAVRLREAEVARRLAARLPGPLILAGDLNTPPRGRIYGRLRTQFQDAFATAGWGWGHTFSSRRPLLRIDYVLTRGLTPAGCWVGVRGPSDHRPVIADLILPDKPGPVSP